MVMQGVDVGEGALIVLFSATSALSGSQGLTGCPDKTPPFIQNVTSFGMSDYVIVTS